MASNNYFGFATGGNQYGSTPAQANYTTGQGAAGYTVQHSAQAYPNAAAAAAAAAQQQTSQSTYETYQTATHSTTTYPYNARQYDKTQTYYTSQPYSTTETGHYQTATNNKPVYSTTNYSTRQATTAQKAQAQPATAGSSYMYSSTTPSAGATSTYASNYSNTATTTYSPSLYAQQAPVANQSAVPATQLQTVQQSAVISTPKVHTNNWIAFKKGPTRLQRPKLPPKPQQLHYCEVCKISCAGPQTYKEHLEGQKHKKKEAASKAGIVPQPSRGATTLRCELCDVTCTGADAYAAHIRGAKHQKVVKLHTKLGKPIPSTEPQVISLGTEAMKKTENKASAGNKSAVSATMKKTAPPKVNFVAAGTTVPDVKEESIEENNGDSKMEEKEIQPVGQDYIEEIKNEEGKVISFQCKLCECRFNDPNAKEMHMKGRRHRLQYKKKVNPDLVVDVKPSLRQRKIQEDRLRRQQLMDELWKRREEERWRDEMRAMEEEDRMYWEERRRYEEELEYYEWHRRFGREPCIGPPMPPPPPRGYMLSMPPGGMHQPGMRKPDSVDDRHVKAKHTQIYPKEDELNAVQKIITNTEKALKMVSDFLTEKYAKKEAPEKPEAAAAAAAAATAATTTAEEPSTKEEEGAKTEAELAAQQYRVLKGVMRVGVLAKGLVLTGDLKVQLVVMCAEKPTRTLLERVIDNLPKQLASVAPDDKYEVKRCIEEAAIIVTSTVEPKISVTIALTSPIMREPIKAEGDAVAEKEVAKDPPDVLDKEKCLEALAALRHAKWFQAKAASLQSCVMVIRILRDLCQRVPTWGHLSGWAMELLVEKVLSSTGQPLSCGEALRRVFEAIASGILLPSRYSCTKGLLDPCEKEPVDATASLSNQEREDITASAQHALRLIAFRQIHKVLGMDPLPPPKFTRGQFGRKRRRDNGEATDTEGNRNGKKDKKEEESKNETMDTAEVATA